MNEILFLVALYLIIGMNFVHGSIAFMAFPKCHWLIQAVLWPIFSLIYIFRK